MFYFEFIANTPYAGTQNITFREFTSYPTEETLEEISEEYKQLNAESFEYLVTGWGNENFDNEEEEEQALEDYYADCYCIWEEISKEKYEENI